MDDSQGRGEQEDQESLGQQTADENQSFYVVDLQQQITNRGGTENEEVERQPSLWDLWMPRNHRPHPFHLLRCPICVGLFYRSSCLG